MLYNIYQVLEDNNSEKKNFWQTLPGILTALAAILTASTGLLLAFNQVGCFHKDAKEIKSANTTSSHNPATADTTNSSVTGNADKITGATFSMTDIKGKGAEHEYKILEAVIEPKDPSASTIKIKIRYTNNIAYPANFWNSGFRLSIDDVLTTPSGDLNEIVAGNSSKEGIVQFDFPNNANKLKLIIFDSDEKIAIPITITKE